MKTLSEIMAELPPARRKKIEKRTAELVAEEMTMRELRKAQQMTQIEMAKTLGVKQEQISRIEKRSDLHLSTLRRSIEAMGGELTLMAKFPGKAPIKVAGFSGMDTGKA